MDDHSKSLEKSLANAYLALHEVDLACVTKALNDFISINIPNASGILKTMTIYNEVLSNSIKELDVSSFISSSTKVVEALKSVDSALLSNIDYEEVINEEYTKEIIDQVVNDVEPEEIAHKLAKKTNIDWKTWIPIICAIIQTLLTIYTTFYQQPQETNNYHIEIKQEISPENSNQITNNKSYNMNNKSNFKE